MALQYLCPAIMDKPVIIFGAGGLGKLALEIFQSNDNMVYGFLDDRKELIGTDIGEVPVLGKMEDQGFLKLIGKKCEAFIAVDDQKLQKGLVNMLLERRKVMPVNAIHQQAFISRSAKLGHGNMFSAGSILNAEASMGNYCMLHSRSLVDYGAIIGDYVQIGAGTVVGAEVEIEDAVFIGTGAVLVSGVKIKAGARIGAGSIVVGDVEKNQTVFGNPAQIVDRK